MDDAQCEAGLFEESSNSSGFVSLSGFTPLIAIERPILVMKSLVYTAEF